MTAPNRQSSNIALLILIPVLLLAVWVGAHGLNADALWNDELYSIRDAGGLAPEALNPAQIWRQVADDNPWHVPGYFVLLSGWARLVGWSPVMLRALSLLLGVLAVAWTYRLGRDLVSARVGLVAALLLATGTFYLYYLSELRMYTAMMLLSAFTVWVYWHIMTAPRVSIYAWLGLLGGAVGLVYTHNLAVFPLVGLAVWHVLMLTNARRDRWWGVVAVMLVAGPLYLPWLLDGLLAGMGQASGNVGGRGWRIDETLGNTAALWGNGSAALLTVTLALASVPLLRRTRRSPGVYWLWALVAAVLVAMLVAHTQVAIFNRGRVRYLSTLLPLVTLLVAVGVVQVTQWRRSVGVALLAVWVLVGIVQSRTYAIMTTQDGTGYRFPAHQATTHLRTVAQVGDGVLFYLPDGLSNWTYREYPQITDFYTSQLPATALTTVTQYYRGQAEEEARARRNFSRDKARLWVATPPGEPPAALTDYRAFLADEGFHRCDSDFTTAELTLTQYARAPVCCVTATFGQTSRLHFDNGVRLLDGELHPATITAADDLTLTTVWALNPAQAADPALHDLSVTLHISAADGAKVAQRDYGLTEQPLTCQQVSLPIADLGAGDFQVSVGVYPRTTGGRIAGAATETGARGDLLPLATFTVDRSE